MLSYQFSGEHFVWCINAQQSYRYNLVVKVGCGVFNLHFEIIVGETLQWLAITLRMIKQYIPHGADEALGILCPFCLA